MVRTKQLVALVGASLLAIQPGLVAAQQAQCITEDEVSAIGIYSAPSLVQSLRLRCGGELSPGGFLAREGDNLIGRYAVLQDRVWPRARVGLLKVFANGSMPSVGSLDMIARLPDESVRPLVDALIVQEMQPHVPLKDCWKVERVVQAIAPIDPEVAGTLLGTAVGIAQPREVPVCGTPRR